MVILFKISITVIIVAKNRAMNFYAQTNHFLGPVVSTIQCLIAFGHTDACVVCKLKIHIIYVCRTEIIFKQTDFTFYALRLCVY